MEIGGDKGLPEATIKQGRSHGSSSATIATRRGLKFQVVAGMYEVQGTGRNVVRGQGVYDTQQAMHCRVRNCRVKN